jgi:hypothetical protein
MDIGSFIQRARKIYLDANPDSELTHYSFHNESLFYNSPGTFKDYQYSAKKKSLTFGLSKSDYNSLVSPNVNCYLCGCKGPVGIDRIDSSIGYEIENCEPCCTTCNYMKKNETLDDFLNQIDVITLYSTTQKHYDLCNNAEFNSYNINSPHNFNKKKDK